MHVQHNNNHNLYFYLQFTNYDHSIQEKIDDIKNKQTIGARSCSSRDFRKARAKTRARAHTRVNILDVLFIARV